MLECYCILQRATLTRKENYLLRQTKMKDFVVHMFLKCFLEFAWNLPKELRSFKKFRQQKARHFNWYASMCDYTELFLLRAFFCHKTSCVIMRWKQIEDITLCDGTSCCCKWKIFFELIESTAWFPHVV